MLTFVVKIITASLRVTDNQNKGRSLSLVPGLFEGQ